MEHVFYTTHHFLTGGLLCHSPHCHHNPKNSSIYFYQNIMIFFLPQVLHALIKTLDLSTPLSCGGAQSTNAESILKVNTFTTNQNHHYTHPLELVPILWQQTLHKGTAPIHHMLVVTHLGPAIDSMRNRK